MNQESPTALRTLGLRHVAIYVRDPHRSKAFYTQVLRMQVEWEPDHENVFLTSHGLDNLAIHKRSSEASPQDPQFLDHIGFALPSAHDVDLWYDWFKQHQVKILREIKTHRDGARSFYAADPDGVVIQMIHHPPIANRSGQEAQTL